MWPTSYLDRWDERQAANDDGNKPLEQLVIGASLAFAGIDEGASLSELARFAENYKAQSANFFKAHRKGNAEYIREGDLLTFSSDIVTETESNGIVRARIYEAKNSRGAILVLPHWNAAMWDYQRFSRRLMRLGFTTVELTLPYHGSRNQSDGIISDYFLSANIGRTIRSVQQAVVNSRRVVDWLYERKHERIGLIGVSLGSCIAGLVAAHDERICTSALFLTAGDFAEVVWTGRATRHIKAALAASAKLEQLRDAWSIISTETYVRQLSRRGHRTLIISGKRDQVVHHYLTEQFVERLRRHGGSCSWHALGCGHYSLGLFPFNIVAFLTLARFFRREGF